MKKKHWIYLTAFLVICIAIIKYHYSGTDVSLYPIKNQNRTYSSQKTWLISYANEGIYIKNQNNLVMSASLHQVFDVIMSYQPHNIDPEYYEKHKTILSQRRGGGYWLWKPYFILQTLKMMPEDDILLYVDSSGVFRDGIYDLLDIAKEHDITVFPNFHSNRSLIKKSVIDKMVDGDESYLDKMQLDGSTILLRNTAKSRAIIEQWLKYSEDSELLTDTPSINEYPDFQDHRHDQAILSLMYHKNPEEFNLYADYPARMESYIITRRKNQCSMLPVTFNNQTKFSWLDGVKYRSIIWLIGCQRFKGS
jgi:hypothetical protein